MKGISEGSAVAPVREPALHLSRGEDGQLWARRGGEEARPPCAVRVCRLFPWSEPGRWVSLRDADDEEVHLVREPSELDPGSREALEEALVEAGFVMELTAILSVEGEVEIRTFEAETAQGPRRFETARDEWPRQLEDGGLLIKDVAGDLYWVRDPQALDPRSRRLLWVFID